MSPAKKRSPKKTTGARKKTTVKTSVTKAVSKAVKAVRGGSAPKKTSAKKSSKKTAAKRSTAKRTAKKSAASKSAPTKATKKTTSKKTTAKKTTPKKSSAKKAAPKKSSAKKAAPKKSSAKKSSAKKTTPKKTTPRKAAPKKSSAKKTAPKKTSAKKTAAGATQAVEEAPAPKRSKLPPRPTPPPAPKKRIKKANLDKKALAAIKARLEQDKADYERQLAELESDSSSDTNPDIGVNEDFADAGTATFDRERDLSIRNNTLDLIDQASRALESIEQGTYGTCERCGSHIDADRLAAFPRVLLCLDCKRREERIR